MAWDSTLTIMVRHLIGDLSTTEIYDDARIQQGIVVSGLIVSQEYSFPTSYTFDLSSNIISPDPTDMSTYDAIAIALFTLKAACMLNLNSYQGAITSGIHVRDGDSEIDTFGGFKGFKDIIEKGPCYSYQKLLDKLRFERSMNLGKAITGPASTDFTGFYGQSAIESFFNYWRW